MKKSHFYEALMATELEEHPEQVEVLQDFPKDLLEVLAEIDAKRTEIYEGKKWTDGDYLYQVAIKLAALNHYLGEYIAQAGYDSATMEGHYKTTREAAKLELLDGETHMTASRADSEKIVRTQDELNEANKADYRYSLLRIKRADTSELIQSILSGLSWLKANKREMQ